MAFFSNYTFVEKRTIEKKYITPKLPYSSASGWNATKYLHPWNSPGSAITFGEGCGVGGGNPSKFFLFLLEKKTFNSKYIKFQMVALVILDPGKTGMKKVGAVAELGYGKKDSKQINGDRDVGDMLVDDLPGKNTKKVLEN